MNQKAQDLFVGMGKSSVALDIRCRAMEAYLRFWLANKPSSKRRFLDQSWTLAKQAMTSFRRGSDHVNVAETFRTFSPAVPVLLEFEWTASRRRAMFEEAIRYGRLAIGLISNALRDKDILVTIYVQTSSLIDAMRFECGQTSDQDELDREGRDYWRRAVQIDREAALEALSRPPGGFLIILDNPETIIIWKDAIKVASNNRDSFGLGWLHTQGAAMSFREASQAQRLQQRVKLSRNSLTFAESAQKIYRRFNFTIARELMWPHSPYAEHFFQLSSFEIDQEKRRNLLAKSLLETDELEKIAKRSMYPKAIAYAHHVASKVRAELAQVEVNPAKKRRLVREASEHRASACSIMDQTQPGSLWSRGVFLTYLAQLKRDLAQLENNRRTRTSILSQAVEAKKKALELTSKFVESIGWGNCRPLHGTVARQYADYGEILNFAYETSGRQNLLTSAANAFSEAVLWTQKSGDFQREMGAYLWMAADAHDRLHDYSTAATEFSNGSRAFQTLAIREVKLRAFYSDRATYLRASAKVEKARNYHSRLEFENARAFYIKAAKEYQATDRWSFLAPYYMALAELENAEALSRLGRYKRSIGAFKKSSTLFQTGNNSIPQPTDHEQPDERRLLKRVTGEPIMEYCRARILIEEARLAETSGDPQTGVLKFHEASKQLKEISKRFRAWEARKEIAFIASLSEGWGLLTSGIAEGSKAQLQLANEKFGTCITIGTDENSRVLARAYALFSRGMEQSTEFAETHDSNDYQSASRNLSNAADCFQKSGFTVAYERTNAARQFLDAQFQLARIRGEEDQTKKSVGLEIAIALLRNASNSFQKARQTVAERYATRIIEQLRADASFSSNLAKISRSLLNGSRTFEFPIPTRLGDLGGLRLDPGVDIEASVVSQEQGSPGKDLKVVIEIANLGTRSIRTIRLDHIAPDGTRILEAVGYNIEEGALLMDGRRLNPSKVETISLNLNMQDEAVIIMRPRLVFDDENGRRHKLDLPPKILGNSRVLEFLSRQFTVDYSMKQLAPTYAGWRTLMEIVNALKIPRNRLYGDPRRGRRYGKEIEALMKVGLVELRVFPGERGRGGQIVKARLSFDNDLARQFAKSMETPNREKDQLKEQNRLAK